jgi:hypothetical protein
MTYEELLRRIVRLESGGNPMAQAKTTSAGGLYGFTSGTLANVLKRMDPETYGGRSADELASLKFDPNVSAAAAKYHLQNDIVPALQKADIPISGATAYSGWFLGPQGAVKAYQADPSEKIADLFPNYIKPNAGMKFEGKPFAEWDVGTFQRWAATKAGTTPAAPSSADAAPLYSGNKAAPQSAGEMLASSVTEPISSWTGWLGQRLGGGLMGDTGAKVPFDAQRPYSPSFQEPMQPMGAQFAGQMPVGGVGPMSAPGAASMALTSRPLPQPDTGWSMDKGTAKDIAGLASAGAALMAAGAPKQTWTPQAPAPVNRGRWRDDLFAGLLGL